MLDLAIFAALVVVGYVVGRILEARHYRSIREREQTYGDIMMFASRFPPTLNPMRQDLVAGSVVVSADYFKVLVARLQGIVGGRLKTYESLLDRARREAILRMKEDARGRGARMIVNVKFQTFSIPGRKPGSLVGVEMLAYGTALLG
ncbi:MAG: YbjQ family protein [Burkholderiales bacterium]|nr:YbjQ family protein [Burkholderiales bacterium]